MRLFPRSLLGRTSLYLGLILVISSVGWTAAVAFFVLRPLGNLYGEMVADTIVIARSLLEYDGAESRRVSQKLAGLRIVADDHPLPHFRDPSQRTLSSDVLERLRGRLGDEIRLEQEQDSKNVWIRFRAGADFYWLAVRVDPPAHFAAVLIWVGGGFAMSIAGAYLIIYQLGRRLRHVTEAARAVGQGRATPSLDETGPQEIRDLSAGFNQMANDLRRVESERRLMLAGISHDLRTPLTRLRIATEFVEAQTDPQLASGMVHDIEELDSILKQFLDYARDGSEEQPVEADLNEIVREIGQRYVQAGHGIRTELEGSLPAFRFRPLALRRVVTNLLENAVRYGREPIEVRTGRAGDRAWLEVADRGSGVAPEHLKEIGRPFVRESPARSDLGAGLGLAIVDRIARAHGGRVELRNRPDGGFLARVELHIRHAN